MTTGSPIHWCDQSPQPGPQRPKQSPTCEASSRRRGARGARGARAAALVLIILYFEFLDLPRAAAATASSSWWWSSVPRTYGGAKLCESGRRGERLLTT